MFLEQDDVNKIAKKLHYPIIEDISLRREKSEEIVPGHLRGIAVIKDVFEEVAHTAVDFLNVPDPKLEKDMKLVKRSISNTITDIKSKLPKIQKKLQENYDKNHEKWAKNNAKVEAEIKKAREEAVAKTSQEMKEGKKSKSQIKKEVTAAFNKKINEIRRGTGIQLPSAADIQPMKSESSVDALAKLKAVHLSELEKLKIFQKDKNNNIIYKLLIKVDKGLDKIWEILVNIYHAVLPKSVLNFVNNIKEKIKKFFMNIWNKIVRFFTGEKAPKSSLMFEADEPKNKMGELQSSVTKIKFLLNLILKCFLYMVGLTLIGNLIIKVTKRNTSIMNSINKRLNFLNDTPIIEQSNSTGSTIITFILWPFRKMFNAVKNISQSENIIVKIIYYAVLLLGTIALISLISFLYELYHKHSLSSNNKKPKTGWLI